jgi:hypothetical protein
MILKLHALSVHRPLGDGGPVVSIESEQGRMLLIIYRQRHGKQ